MSDIVVQTLLICLTFYASLATIAVIWADQNIRIARIQNGEKK